MNFSLMFCLIVATALITAENFRSAYIVNKENRRFARQAVKKIDSPSLLSCSQACLRHSWCTSTNFRESFGKRLDTGHCELHKYVFATIHVDTSLTDEPGSTFSMFLKGCLMTGCRNGGSCVFDEEKETFACSCTRQWRGEKCDLEKWKKINTGPVCFGARDDSYGTFNIRESGVIHTFKLVHLSGSISCSPDTPPSYWGCENSGYGDKRLLTVITFKNRSALLLADYTKGCGDPYKIEGVGVNDTELRFNNLFTPISVSVGKEFQIWYGQDLTNCSDDNNNGQTCADVYAWYA